MVYSTCSLNPVENEAVITRVLRESQGSVKLVDITGCLPGLKSRPGLKKWRVASRDLAIYDEFSQVPEKWETQVRPSMFPIDEEFHLEQW